VNPGTGNGWYLPKYGKRSLFGVYATEIINPHMDSGMFMITGLTESVISIAVRLVYGIESGLFY